LHVYLAARHVALSDELRAYVEQHLLEPIRNHNGLNIIRTEIQLYPEGAQGACHVLVEIKGHQAINIRERQDTILAAIDIAKDRVLHALTEVRDRLLTTRRHPKKFSFERLGRALGWTGSNRTREA
jgi:ribosome-associated translation inhibitor RaiA